MKNVGNIRVNSMQKNAFFLIRTGDNFAATNSLPEPQRPTETTLTNAKKMPYSRIRSSFRVKTKKLCAFILY